MYPHGMVGLSVKKKIKLLEEACGFVPSEMTPECPG